MGSYAPIYHMLHEQTVTVSWCPVKCKGKKETGYPPPPPPPRRYVCVCGGLMWRGGGVCLNLKSTKQLTKMDRRPACFAFLEPVCTSPV